MIYASEVTKRSKNSLGEELASTLRRLQDEYGYKVLNIFESSRDICGSTYKSFIVIYDTSTEEKQQGEWIPVSERLPERYKEVIVTDIETIYVYQSRYIGDGYWECDNGTSKNNRIIAWQPLPEPYKKGGT